MILKTVDPDPDDRLTSKWAFGAVVAGVAVIVAYFAFGMPGMDHGAATPAAHEMDDSTTMGSVVSSPTEMTPQGFRSAMSNVDSFVVNVHVPYEGEIDGTDAFIPFDSITDSPDLPADLDVPILLYCRSGRMSLIAGEALLGLGYTDVAHLTGGMQAWSDRGLPLTNEAQ